MYQRGCCFAYTESRYFAVAKIQHDQLKDFARRSAWSN
ncbi:vitamin B12 dependent-methionine synthase activation domain-containing protein [Glaciecola sp. SC05]